MSDNLKKIKQLASDIKTIKIQGATKIAKQGLLIFADEIENNKFSDIQDLKIFLDKSDNLIRNARETEPMLFNGLDLIYNKKLKNLSDQKVFSNILRKYVSDLEKEEKKRTLIGTKLIKSGYNIATHCHSTSVVNILTSAWQKGKKIHVYNTETRPLYQGRKTSTNLLQAGVPVTMITDGIAPFFVDNLYEFHIDIDMVILGCDAIKLDGTVYNKVGSFGIALSAWHSNIPVYVVGSLTKVDTHDDINIEIRSGLELRPDAPDGLEFINYAFDLIPPKFITGIITGDGIIKPNQIKKYFKNKNKK